MRRLNVASILLFLLITGVLFTPVICHAKEKDSLVPIAGENVKDGVYSIEVESSSSMFRIVEAQLAVENGEMTAVLTMSGTGYLKVYMGTAQEALAAEEEEYIPFVENEEGAHTYTVPVKALNQEIACAAFSKKKEQWYDRELIFLAETLPREALLIDLSEEETVEETPQEASKEQAESPGLSPVTMPVADGEYRMEINFTGGTGWAKVLSPVKVRVAGQTAIALLEWNSANYEYMVVNGITYQPVNTEGNSVFEIPVLALDQEIPVIGYTVAMSQPHEIEYQLTFLQSTLEKEGNNNVFILVVILVAVLFIVGVFFYGKKRKSKEG